MANKKKIIRIRTALKLIVISFSLSFGGDGNKWIKNMTTALRKIYASSALGE